MTIRPRSGGGGTVTTIGPRVTVVGSRNNTGYLGKNGSSASQTFVSKHCALADIMPGSLLVDYGNSYGTGSGPAGDGPGDLAVTCSVALASAPTVMYRGSFTGARVATIKPGATATTDPFGPVIPKGTFFYVFTFVTGDFPTGLTLNYAKGLGQDTTGDSSVTTDSGEGIASPTGTDTTATGAKTTSYVVSYGPLLIRGSTRNVLPCFVGIGDSIMSYSNEAPDMGWFTRAIANQWPSYKLAQPGESAAHWVLDGQANALVEYRKKLMRYGTHFIFAHGRNDFSGNISLATMQARWLVEWNEAVALGGLAYQTTITPKVTTTDQYATLVNQTPVAGDAARIAGNDWIRDGAPMLAGAFAATGSNAPGTIRIGQSGHPLAGYIELADVMESSRNSGKFAVDKVRIVTDAASTSGSKTVTSATAAFSGAVDLGACVFMAGSGAAGATQAGVIAKVTDAQTITQALTASTTATGQQLQIGSATYDGTHPGGDRHRQMAAVAATTFAAAAAAYTG